MHLILGNPDIQVSDDKWSEEMENTMPAIFFGHGNPMNALLSNGYTKAWSAIGNDLSKPTAVLAVSAHWYVPGTFVTTMSSPRTIHLHAYAWSGHPVEPLNWGLRFEDQARALLLAGDHQPLIDYESMGQDAVLSVPTPDHYLPFLYVIALQSKDEPVSFPVEGFDGGSISMLAVKIG